MTASETADLIINRARNEQGRILTPAKHILMGEIERYGKQERKKGYKEGYKENKPEKVVSYFTTQGVHIRALAKSFGLSEDTLYHRIERGWDLQRALLETPNEKYHHRSRQS